MEKTSKKEFTALDLYKTAIDGYRDMSVKVFSDRVLRNDLDPELTERKMNDCRKKLLALGYLNPCQVGKDWNSLVNARLIPRDYTLKDLNREYNQYRKRLNAEE